jgi:hypothetical protein
MRDVTLFSGSRRDLSTMLGKVPVWAVAIFAIVMATAFAPNLLHVYGIHNDYEMIYFKGSSFFHPEAEHLVSIVRPVSALLTNLPMLPVHALDDYLWTRLFSLFTVCAMGALMMGICVHRLHTTALDAFVIALATFLTPPFIYSILAATAWAGHLLPVLLAFAAYVFLSRSNVLALPFLQEALRGDYRRLWRQIWSYAQVRSVWWAAVVFEIALFTHPPNALIITVLPVMAVLFSRAPLVYRALIAGRDIAFIGSNLILYAVSTKLLYLPFVRLFTSLGSGEVAAEHGPMAERVASTYRFAFNTDIGAAWLRLLDLARVAGDLWFLPQIGMHFIAGIVIVLAVLASAAMAWRESRSAVLSMTVARRGSSLPALEAWPLGVLVMVAVPAVCLMISSSPVLLSATGFVTYRTIAIPIVIVAIVFIYAVRTIAEAVCRMSRIRRGGAESAAAGTMILMVAGAAASNFQANYLTMRLAGNELAYFTDVVRQAVRDKSKAIVIVDPRPFALPEDVAVVYDQGSRAIPPFELGCFSGYCLQTGAIVHMAAARLGYPMDYFKVYSARGADPVPGLTCAMLSEPKPSYPPNASEKSINTIAWLRAQAPLTCVTYDLAWHDLSRVTGE